MAKKVILGALFLGLIGVLVVGAVNRTVAKTADIRIHQAGNQRGGFSPADDEQWIANGKGQGRDRIAAAGLNQSSLQIEGQELGLQGTNGQGYGRWRGGGSNSQMDAAGVPYAATEDHQWEKISGAVVSIDAAQLILATAGGEVVIADRPWNFALQQGFTAQPGDQVTVSGFYENGTFKAGHLINETSGQETAIRKDSGRPLWAVGVNGGRGGRGRAF